MFHPNAERMQAGEQGARIFPVIAAQEHRLALRKGGKDERAVQNALGGGRFHSKFLGRKGFYAIIHHIASITNREEKVKR